MTVPGTGPQPAKLMIVGEAPGLDETLQGAPFIGASGKELDLWLSTVNIPRASCYITNVFKMRPEKNNILNFCYRPEETKPALPALFPGFYVKPELAAEALAELDREIAATSPSLILALGNTALWALTGKTGINKYRGYLHQKDSYSILPTFHPSAVLRGINAGSSDDDGATSGRFDYRAIALCDAFKAARFISGKLKTTSRRICVIQSIEDLASVDLTSDLLTFDIETKGRYGITCVGLAPNTETVYVLPFFSSETGNYWASADDELTAWRWLKEALESPTPKLAHNGAYDLQWLARMGIRVNNYQHDTMLLHHALYPELPKSLLALGSIYCNEMNWKSLTREEKDDK